MPKPASRRLVLFATTLASFLTPFMGASVNVALPAIGREFALGPIGLSWVATSYLLAAAMLLVPFGKVADLRGRTPVFLVGMAVYTGASLICAVAGSAGQLVAARVLQGLGGAMVFGTSVAILTSAFPPEQRGRVLGINVAAVYLGLSLGPSIGGLLTQHLGWRSVFGVNVAAGTITWLVAALSLPRDTRPPSGRPFDWAGSVLYSAGLAMVVSGFSRLPGGPGALLVAGGTASLALFFRRERAIDDPLLDVRLFSHNRVFAYSNLAALINYAATYAVGFLLSLYLQNVRGLGAQAAGLLLVAQPLVQAAVSPFAGRLSDRVAPRTLASSGMTVIVFGLAILSFLDRATPTAWVAACLGVLGVGFGLFSSPNTSAVMGSVGGQHYGVASATLATMRMTGQAFSMGIAMLVFAMTGASAAPGDAMFLAGIRVCFGVFAVLCVGGVMASLARGRE